MNKILNCTRYEQSLLTTLAHKIQKLQTEYKITPKLVTLLASNNPSSKIYIAKKTIKAKRLGIEVINKEFTTQNTQSDILATINDLNHDHLTHAILMQLPTYDKFDENQLLSHILPNKDVDGLHPHNIAALTNRNHNFINSTSVVPCTPLGILYTLQQTLFSSGEKPPLLEGKNILVIGKSKLVGLSIALLLLSQQATVMVAHSKTHNLKQLAQNFDIVIVAIGKAEFITHDYFKKQAIVIDVGINPDNMNQSVVGDVKKDDALLEKISYITPVPKGIGVLTTTFLMYNTYKLALINNGLTDTSYDVFNQ